MDNEEVQNDFLEKTRELDDVVLKFAGKETEKENGFKFLEDEDPQSFLETITKGGNYLFSGSSRMIGGTLNPDSSVSKKSVVYMSRNPVSAMFNELVGGADNKLSREYTITMQIDDGIGEITYPVAKFSVGNPDSIASEGYVYIFKNSLKYIRNDNGEYLSSEQIVPDLVLRFGREKFHFEIKTPEIT